tara:strand:+ start:1581 stop:1964 length:384 start_codon:yes stop_codon:yes gene_type:complete
MASILRVNTITDASSNNSIATSFVAGGSAKAWINLNGTGTIATRDTFNIASTVDNGTGNYDAVFTSNMSNANYSVTGTVADNIPIASNRDSIFQCVAESASQINLNIFSSSQQDRNHVCGQVFGDLA